MRNTTRLRAAVRRNDGTVVLMLEKDFLLNFLALLLLLIGDPSALVDGRSAEDGAGEGPADALPLYLEADGALRMDGAPLEIGDVAAAVANHATIIIHHTPEVPAGRLHPVLRAIGNVPGASPLLALTGGSR